ncbi:hypothetical protein EDB87DRAFT_1691579 [Lactarius vividus]|nr:hypothetical protein EDB87DRAFT_1691579 [Lactarius vividus]
MEEDEPLNSLKQQLEANNGGTAASMHMPSHDMEVPPLTEPPIPVAEPKQPPARSTDLSAPFHVPLEYSPSRLAAPLPLAPPQAAEEETRLDAQDKRIMESLEVKIEGPKPKGKQVRLADPPKTPSGSKVTSMEKTLSVTFRPEPRATSTDSCSTAEQYRAEWVAAARSEGIDPGNILHYERDPGWQAPWE